MKHRHLIVGVAIAIALVSFSAGTLLAKGDGLKRLNLPGRSDSRPFTHTIVAPASSTLAFIESIIRRASIPGILGTS